MTPRQIGLVRQSFALAGGSEEAIAALFYARLFEIDPPVRAMFPADLRAQGGKLMEMLTLVVRALDDLEALGPAIEGLARRHVGYGVAERHYESVGAALVWTLGEALDGAFTPDVRAAWIAAYAGLSTVMVRAACAAEPAL